jgi:fructokinase
VVGLGELLWDLLPTGKQCGGAPANFTYHAQALGAEAWLVTRVGDDELGDELRQHVVALGLPDVYLTTDPDHPTGTVAVELDGFGQPKYVIHEHVAWDFIPPREDLAELALRADAVCFGTLAQRNAVSRTTIRDFLAATRNDCLRIFDVNLRQRYYNMDTIAPSLAAATVVKLNEDEFAVFRKLLSISGDEPTALGTMFRRFGLRLIVLTKGAGGAVLFGSEGLSVHPGLPSDVTDTIGAGDAFTAVVAVGLLRGWDLQTINARANRLAAYVCSQPGATPPIPPSMVEP